jgi:hypothetical protein
MALPNSKEPPWGYFKLQKKSRSKDHSSKLSSHWPLPYCSLNRFLIFHLLIYCLSLYLLFSISLSIYIFSLINAKKYINLQITMSSIINKRKLSSSKSLKQHTEQNHTVKKPLRLLNLS